MEKPFYEDDIVINIRELLYELKKKIWIILLGGMIGGAILGGYSKFRIVPQYTSTSMLYVVSAEARLTSLSDLEARSQLTKDYTIIVTSRPVLEQVIDELGLNLNHRELRNKITISNPTDTRILRLTVMNSDPYMAKVIVDTVSRVASQYIGELMDVEPPRIIEDGEVIMLRVSPNVKKNTLIGSLLGVMIVCGSSVLLMLLNDDMKTEEDIERYLDLPILAVIPKKDENKKVNKALKVIRGRGDKHE